MNDGTSITWQVAKNLGPWSYDELARELQAASLRIVEVAADGAHERLNSRLPHDPSRLAA